jgi:hypothetical protein
MDEAGGPALSRRDVIRLAGGALLLAACDSGSTAKPTPTPSAAPTTPSPSATASLRWSDLQARMKGQLLLPGASAYDAARLSANPRYDGLRPAAVARCTSAADVAAVVTFAREQRLAFSVRSGGHSYAGYSTSPDLVLDLSAMGGAVVSGPSMRVGAGARLVDVYTAAAGHGRGIAAGSCPTVGFGGLTLGGGVGVLSRAWGLTCDAVTAYQLVTADGLVREVDASSDPDLLWAGKGGGGGSFGVVTSFTTTTRPATALTLWAIHWPWSAAADVVDAWQHWGPVTDSRCWSTCKLHAGGGAEPTVLVAGTWIGGGLDAGLAPLLASVGTAPSSKSSRLHGYLDAMLTEAGCSGAGCHLPPAGSLVREPLAATSHVPATTMSAAGTRAVVRAVEGAAGTHGLRQVTASLDALGGAVAQVRAADTAFAHRTSPYTVQYTATWTDPALPGAPFDAVVRGMRAAMTPYLGAGAYLNYCDASLPGWEQAYWGANYPRLQAVKRAVDPDEVFTFAQSVRP